MAKTYNFIEEHSTNDNDDIISKIELIDSDVVVHSEEGLNTDNYILNLKDAWLSLNN